MPPTIPVTLIAHSIGTRLLAASISTALVFALSGCSTPRLQSTVDVPTQFIAAQATVIEPEVAWWESYGDPTLSELVARAARENRDIQIAVQRVRAARAGETISRSALLPSVSAVATATDASNGYSGNAQQGAPETKSASAGLNVSWEIDLTGRLRAGAAAAAADAQASKDQARGVRLLVLADVASNYFTLVGAMRQLDNVRAIASTQEETLRLVTARQHAGLASLFDVERASTDASRAQAAIPPLETLVASSRHRLAVLIGSQPSAAVALVPWSGTARVPEVQPGQPASLLERRPDLLAYRSQLEAANWRRQQAVAEWFPRLFVSALFGRENLQINGQDLGSARFGNVAGLLAMPVFDWGRTRSINDIAESAQSEMLLRYEDAIVRAFEDVENGLVALSAERNRAQALQNAATSSEVALSHAQSLYRLGQIDLLPLLDAQRAQLAVKINANDSQTQLLLDSVQLFKALGGGWQAFEPGATDSAHTAAPQSLISNNEESS